MSKSKLYATCRTFSVYQDRATNELAWVEPRHYKNGFRLRVIRGVFKQNGYRPPSFICESVRAFSDREFLKTFSYVGGGI